MSALLQTIPLAPDAELAPALAALPPRAGIGQIVGPEGQSLVVARAANLRRWAAAHLGGGPPPKPGRRPRTNLRPITSAVRYALTTSAFQQRLAFERLLQDVPLAKRRDLRPTLSIHLDPTERFPRATIRPPGPGPYRFGPFRDRASAGRALSALHRRFPLRPCDYDFEPHPELPLGLACVYYQVRSCAAPCVGRSSEADYRALAARAAEWLGDPERRAAEDDVPPWIGGEGSARALVVEPAKDAIELYPVVDWAVIEEASQRTPEAALDEAVGRLRWQAPPPGRDDRAWLMSWLHARPRGRLVVVPAAAGPAEVTERARAALGR